MVFFSNLLIVFLVVKIEDVGLTANDAIISCPEEIRLKRILKRDDLSEKDVRQRMSHQWAEEKKISLSDYVITNDNSSLVMPQILSVHSALK